MRDGSFREQFDTVAKAFSDGPRQRMLVRVLDALRDCVQEMQDNGYPVTFETRMRDGNAPMHLSHEERKHLSANGSIRFGEGGPALEFACHHQYSDQMHFKAYIGTQEVINQYVYGEDMALVKQGMLKGLMLVQAEHEMLVRFTLGDRNDKTRMLGKSILPKPPNPN
jgi:hypothetical protein